MTPIDSWSNTTEKESEYIPLYISEPRPADLRGCLLMMVFWTFVTLVVGAII